MNICHLVTIIFLLFQSGIIDTTKRPVSNGTTKKSVQGQGQAPPPYYQLSFSSFDSLSQYDLSEDTLKDDENNSTTNRRKRKLQINEITKKVIMLMTDKDKGIGEAYKDILPPMNRDNSSLQRIDFIIRLQEKYEYSTCQAYLDSVPEWKNIYFLYDEDLVNLKNENDTDFKGTNESRTARINEAKKTLDRRYRMWGEPCDPDAEWEFWRDMFIASENDTIAIPKKTGTPEKPGCAPANNTACNVTSTNTTTSTGPAPPVNSTNGEEGNLEEFEYVQIEHQDMMLIWNKIWRKYRTRRVCNPRLLLECPDEKMVLTSTQHTFAYSEAKKCRCQADGVGLPNIVQQSVENATKPYKVYKTPANVFTRQYYEDLEENVHDETVRHYGQYVHKKKCVVAAHVPNHWLDAQILNPCDYFLPMIGMCSAECHYNATCLHVSNEERKKFLEYSKKTDFYTRVRTLKVHEVYYQKCVCKKGHSCRKDNEVMFEGANTFRKGYWLAEAGFFVILQIILFKICML